ncbi:MAG: magnesium transporter CorA family protein [Candidatus Pristimantibacillus sp.]
MIHRVLRYPAKWEWHVLQQERQQTDLAEGLPKRRDNKHTDTAYRFIMSEKSSLIQQEEADEQRNAIKRQLPECSTWLDECSYRTINQITVAESLESGPLLHGTLMFQVSEQQTDIHPFHFWLSQGRLVTLHDDLRLTIRLQADTAVARLENCHSAPEALFIMIGIILNHFHEGLDEFENQLGELERNMRNSKRIGRMDVIFERRHELLHWSHLFLPVKELHGAAKEAFMEPLTETDSFKRITHKLDRIEALLNHYALEMDTLISMDDAVSSFRGNVMMKTLTKFIVLLAPASVLAGVWATNFPPVPWDHSWWGFTLLCSIVFVITILLYIWLWRKGLMGNLLEVSPVPKRKLRSERISQTTFSNDEQSISIDLSEQLPKRRRSHL